MLDRPQGSLHYIIEGSDGAPATVVLIHGLCCDHTDWSAQVETLAARHRVLACDLRGHGASRFEAGFDIPTYAEDVVALLESLAIERAVLVGHSMGCRVILHAATLMPERVRGLVLVDGSRFATGDAQRAREQARAFIDVNGGWENVVHRLFTDMFIEGSDPAYVAKVVKRAAQVPAEVAVQVFISMVTWDASEMRSALASLAAELMVVQSTYVNAARERVSIESAQANPWLDFVREHVPDVRIELIDGVGHFAQIEAPAAVSGLIEEFSRGQSP
ncbi:MAG: alpha/beta fold hydrolase [Gammaproteobacteria bacterium]|nr:alpha/beta fold hydrolase [Gammaproteobacteria bacterium]